MSNNYFPLFETAVPKEPHAKAKAQRAMSDLHTKRIFLAFPIHDDYHLPLEPQPSA